MVVDVKQALGHGRPRGKPRCSESGDPLCTMLEQSRKISLLDLSLYS